MTVKLDRRAFLGTALTFGALCAASPSEALGVTAAQKKAEVQSVKQKLDAMTEELEAAVDEYNNTQDKYNAATKKVKACQKKISQAQAKIDTLQAHLETRATSMYRNGAMSYLDVLLGVGSFDDFATVWDTLNNLNEDDADLVMEKKATKAELESAKKELDEQQAEAKEQVETAAALKRDIDSKLDSYTAEYESLSSEYQQLLQEEEEAEARRAARAARAYTPAVSNNQSSESNSQSSGNSGNSGGSSNSGNSGNSGGSEEQEEEEEESSTSGSSTSSSIPSNGGVVDYARSRIGCPYVWGASGPNQFDCSGLTMWCYAQIGISMSHYTESQYAEARARLSVYSAAAGDILYKSGHVGIYSGGDDYIHAPKPGDYVKETSGIGRFSAALRF